MYVYVYTYTYVYTHSMCLKYVKQIRADTLSAPSRRCGGSLAVVLLFQHRNTRELAKCCRLLFVNVEISIHNMLQALSLSLYIYICIYIYIERERDLSIYLSISLSLSLSLSLYTYIYIYIYVPP